MHRNSLLFSVTKLLQVSLALVVLTQTGLAVSFSQPSAYFALEPLQDVGPQKTSAELEEVKRLEQEADKFKKERKYDLAIPLLIRGLEIRERLAGTQSADITSALNDLGELSYLAGNYDAAIGFMARALAIREKFLKPNDSLIAESLYDLASLYVVKGDLITPESMLQRALAIQEKASTNSLDVASTLNSLATLYENRGDRKRAEPLYKRSLAIREKELGGQHRLVAISLNNLGRLYMANRDFVNAEQLYQRSLKIRETVLGADSPDLAVPIANLATLFYEQGKFNQAQPLFQRALGLQEKALGPKHPALVNTLNNLADVLRHKGDFDGSEKLYQRSLEVALPALGANHSAVALIFRGYALLEQARGQPKAAVSFLVRCNNIREQNLSLVLTSGSETQKLLYMETLADETDVTVSLHLRQAADNLQAAQLALTTILQRKGRVLDVMSRSIETLRRRSSPEDLVLIEELTRARGKLANLKLSTPNQVPSAGTQVAELEKKIEQLEQAVSARSSQFRATSQTVSIDRVQRAIPDDGALVEFVAYRPFDVTGNTGAESFGSPKYAAYILSKLGEPAWVELGDGQTIGRAVARFRKSLGSPSSLDYRRAGRALDELTMRPVRKFLGNKRRLFLSPDADLNLIPFAALVDENDRFLIQSYAITYLTSGRDLLQLLVKSNSREGLVVLANPAFDRAAISNDDQLRNSKAVKNPIEKFDAIAELPPSLPNFAKVRIAHLPGTAQEASSLKSIFPDAEMFTGAFASEAVVKKIRAPRMLHIATHGFFLADQAKTRGSRQLLLINIPEIASSESPLLRSGLLLAGVKLGRSGTGEDGVLTALEVADLDLWGTKLVVLSACDTGLGEVRNGEGVYGLRRALVLAGTESQVISLWQVSDFATRDLMIAYYKSLKVGVGRSDALRNVQLAMIDGTKSRSPIGRRRTHPYYWASFIQSGEWRSI